MPVAITKDKMSITINQAIGLLVEKYRPTIIDHCVLPQELKDTFNNIIESGECPNLMLAGKPGMGKTTVARALCTQLGADYIIINCSEDGNIDTLRTKIRQFASTVSLSEGAKQKIVILDEFDYSNAQSIQPALRGAIEEFAKTCRFILTCNYKNRIIEPIHSRCTVIDFNFPTKERPELAKQFLARCQAILEEEGIEYDLKVLSKVVVKYFPDFRRTLNELQRYSTAGIIDIGILSTAGELDIKQLMGHMKSKNYGEVRKWVSTNMDNAPQDVFRKVFDGLNEYLKPESIPSAILVIAEYQYKTAFVADQEINLCAFFTEIMMSCEFK
jgi:replication factor C small subunit